MHRARPVGDETCPSRQQIRLDNRTINKLVLFLHSSWQASLPAWGAGEHAYRYDGHLQHHDLHEILTRINFPCHCCRRDIFFVGEAIASHGPFQG